MTLSSVENNVVLLTATIDPQGVSYVVLANPKERLVEYLASLLSWIRKTRVTKIVFCENSGFPFDYSEIIELAKLNGKEIEILTYHDNANAQIHGKGYGEGEILNYSLDHSELLSNASGFIKATGRLFFPEIDSVIERHAQNEAAFRMIDLNRWVDTRIFICDKKFFDLHLRTIYTFVDDEQCFIEQAYYKALKGIVTENVDFGAVVGRSGSEGNEYDTYFDESILDEARAIAQRGLTN